jgi:hypothetical protein
MRRKYGGYIFQFTGSDPDGHHIHVFRDNRQLGVFDLNHGAIRGLERHWNNALQEALQKFISDLNDRGHFIR